jgi:hypothetical protein
MKTRTIFVMALMLVMALSSVAMAAVQPILVDPWQSGPAATECAAATAYTGVTYTYGYKIDGWDAGDKNGDYTATFGDGHSNTITIENSDGTYFDWSASPNPIGAVIVKGGNAAHIFAYDPQANSDTGLYSPDTSGGGPAAVSHATFCWNAPTGYEELTVSKTAETSYIRTHRWSIDKSVETDFGYEHEGFPKIWLYIDGSGDETATWTVDVSYEGYEDSGFNVSGDITVKNTGTLDAVITDISDVLGGTEIDVDCGEAFPYTLEVGNTLTCSYDVDVDGKISGKNEVDVTTEVTTYSAEAAVIWGEPTSEFNASVTIQDVSDLFGEVSLGTLAAPNGGTFTYSKDFAWADYGQYGGGDYTYDNTATIVETGQSASATLKVNVQRYLYETAFAKGSAAECFIDHGFSRWGWTNPILPGTYTWDLWAGAGQCDTSKGTLVGSVTVVYAGSGNVTVTYNVSAPYLLDETHVYADDDMFPADKRGRPTVAPGQYYNASPFDGREVYVIAHAVVGIPDPDFGP